MFDRNHAIFHVLQARLNSTEASLYIVESLIVLIESPIMLIEAQHHLIAKVDEGVENVPRRRFMFHDAEYRLRSLQEAFLGVAGR